VKNCKTGRVERPASQRVVEVRSAGADVPTLARWANLGPAPGGIRPLRPHEGSRCTPTGPGTHDGVSIWHRRSRPVRAGRATASNLDTHLDRGVGRRVRMLLSFQRPSHLFGRGFLPGGASETSPIPERTGEYSARPAARRSAAAADDSRLRPPRGGSSFVVRPREEL
jgi:hypothetical protein